MKVTKAEDSDKVSENMNFFQELLSMHYHLTTGLKDKCPVQLILMTLAFKILLSCVFSPSKPALRKGPLK